MYVIIMFNKSFSKTKGNLVTHPKCEPAPPFKCKDNVHQMNCHKYLIQQVILLCLFPAFPH